MPFDATAERILVIYNPVAGRRRRRFLSRVLEALERRGLSVRLEPTKKRGDAESLARGAKASGADRLVVAGGDGTINESLNGLEGPMPPLAIVPLGTANVLAHELGLGRRAEAVAAAIAEGQPRAVTLGLVNGRRFSMMAGVGFDAHVVRDVDPNLKRLIGKGAYALETLRQLFVFAPRFYDVTIDGAKRRAASVIVCNGHYYGGKFVAAPTARLDAPEFQVVLFERAGRLATLRYALALALNRLPKTAGVAILPARTVEIAGPAGEPVQADGDIVARLPARFDAIPEAARLVGPA
jgi:YegS/Rv2252/BmrU family lipid kinase